MLHAFVFSKVAVIVRHWFEIGMADGVMEHGARLELRLLGQEARRGTESAAQRYVLDRPIWRADLFDRLDRPAGTFSAAHFHATFDGVEPSDRMWSTEIKHDPWSWAVGQLSNIDKLCEPNGIDVDSVSDDVTILQSHAQEIIESAKALSPAACTSVGTCHRWTSDTAEAVRIMANNMTAPELLDKAYVAPWLDES
jgi:hypothetical protein